ncbi:nitrate reductase molybdenum cofactor assembly chaperone [Nocardioides terrisoli]|uniref:nitrate reductase molybdenum cofactor assembly chaperone n=1 Tax=Nocardioides terrisoli TaxID=3388267 RepID=UPI00287B6056|nr:nitrate reductase molybdenum cofactor assembly chaperone [Nocardioides marmorisolisilvae]
MSRHPSPALPADQLTVAWQSASLLLSYPDEALLERLPTISAALDLVPARIRDALRGVVDFLASGDLTAMQQQYVETFDSRRRTNLYLTYFAHGDTRKRGLALLRFKQTYLRSGFVLDAGEATGGELPDHLCVVLEYTACVDQRLGWKLVLDHRAGLELLRLALRESGSPWSGAVEAVCATLPKIRGEEMEAVHRLAAEGPPAEEVGLTPYGTPAFDAALEERGVHA